MDGSDPGPLPGQPHVLTARDTAGLVVTLATHAVAGLDQAYSQTVDRETLQEHLTTVHHALGLGQAWGLDVPALAGVVARRHFRQGIDEAGVALRTVAWAAIDRVREHAPVDTLAELQQWLLAAAVQGSRAWRDLDKDDRDQDTAGERPSGSDGGRRRL